MSNMARFLAGDIGSMSDWLPSLRSVDSHRGALVIDLPGHCRSGRSTGLKGAYRWQGMPLGVGTMGATDRWTASFCCVIGCFLWRDNGSWRTHPAGCSPGGTGFRGHGFRTGRDYLIRRPATCLKPATREPALSAPAAATKQEQLA